MHTRGGGRTRDKIEKAGYRYAGHVGWNDVMERVRRCDEEEAEGGDGRCYDELSKTFKEKGD